MKFINGEQMLAAITLNGLDLYNTELELYVFCYNENGSIAAYNIDAGNALKLAELAEANDEYWSTFLGLGGLIYDSLEYKKQQEFLKDNVDSALEFCEQYFDKGEWMQTK